MCEEYEGIKSESNKVLYTLDLLHPCTEYQLQIFPTVLESELNSELNYFKTKSPTAKAPQLTVSFDDKTNKIEFDWPEIQCATGYKIHQRTESANKETVWESESSEELSATIGSLEPCVKYRLIILNFI